MRTGRKSAHPLVIIPGGPGVASVQLYRGWRRRAAVKGLDVIMIEHRGIGMSRHTDAGTDLPPEAITIDQVVDDVAAVLDDAGVDKAVLYGTSYGTYIAAGVGVRHPDRVRAMILDSPLLSTRRHRRGSRRRPWRAAGGRRSTDRGAGAQDPPTRRRRSDDNAAGHVATMVYAYGGAALLDRQLDLLLRGRTWLWSGLSRLGAMSSRKAPYRNEIDLVARIAFRELDYAGVPDGLPLDPAAAMREMTDITASFESEPYDLVAEMPAFDWPTVVVSGGRDLTTPPSVAERIAALIPGAALVRLPTAGHSVLDTRERAAFAMIEAVRSDDIGRLSAPELDALPGRPAIRLMVSAISAAAAIESALPAAVPRVVQRVTAS